MQKELMGVRYAGVTLATMNDLSDFHTYSIIKWCKDPKNILLVYGAHGTGKTHLSAAIYHHIFENCPKFRNEMRYFHEDDLLRRLRSVIETNGDFGKELEYLMDYKLLILDDLGSNKHTDFREDVMFNAVDNVYVKRTPCIITSNLNRADFEKTYHPRIASRLFASENILLDFSRYESKRDQGF